MAAPASFGLPRTIRTDNEAVFTSQLFGVVLQQLGISHRRNAPHSPWQNARIERPFGSLKQVLDPLSIAGPGALQAVLDQFSVWYNAMRPHQHLHGRTPLEAWHGIDPFTSPVVAVMPFQALDGRLAGFYLCRR